MTATGRRFQREDGTLARSMSQLNLILLGPPGAGKGTQAERIIEDFDLPYYATGDILRAAVKEESELGKKAKSYMDAGDLVPDDLICAVIMERIDTAEAADGFLLDGFPRTKGQAKTLEDALEKRDRGLTAALLIDVEDETVIKRLSGRRVCSKKGHNYHVDFDPPKREGVCDQDGSKLIQRDDDKPETIKHRLEVYHEQTSPLIEHYERHGILKRFDGTRPPGEVHDHIRATVATLRLEEQV
jgi:adenylate kinase